VKRPTLIPPCPSWKEDFNLPNELTHAEPAPELINANYQDNIYLEISRHSITMRELLLLLAIASLFGFAVAAHIIIESITDQQYSLIPIDAIFLIIGIWQSTSFIRSIRLTPRDEPIRFNRVRQKIYAYNFNFCWWNPFIPWPIKIVSYDWKDVRAERWRKQAVTHQGSHLVKTGIMLSIVEPGTNKVIDRFPLNNEYGEASIWAYVCTYMQHGLSAVPPAPLNRDHNDILWCQFAMRLAPEVKWPEAIDHESRTVPQTAPLAQVESP